MVKMSTEETLRKAAELLRLGTWGQGDGSFCMRAALSATRARYSAELEEVVGQVVGFVGGESSWPQALIADFNDSCCETVDDAIAALEIAADLAA